MARMPASAGRRLATIPAAPHATEELPTPCSLFPFGGDAATRLAHTVADVTAFARQVLKRIVELINHFSGSNPTDAEQLTTTDVLPVSLPIGASSRGGDDELKKSEVLVKGGSEDARRTQEEPVVKQLVFAQDLRDGEARGAAHSLSHRLSPRRTHASTRARRHP